MGRALTRTRSAEAGPADPVDRIIQSAKRTIATEKAGLAALEAALGRGLDGSFPEAVALLRGVGGRVIVTGLGKSGHVARKVAATLSSTGTPAIFVHPAEASHGDLGMITRDDAILALSWSGENGELKTIVEYSRRFRIPLVAMTAHRASSLAREADVVLDLPRAAEACPHGLAPTTSAVMQLALGDAIAIALLESRGFTAEDFRIFHPGGRLGASLHFVRDIMHTGDSVPLVPRGTLMDEAILHMTAKGFGCLGIIDGAGCLVGIITDGDLRRHVGPDLLSRAVDEVMTATPKTVRPDTLVGAAIELLNSAKITAVFVVEDTTPVGVLHMHDLLRLGVA